MTDSRQSGPGEPERDPRLERTLREAYGVPPTWAQEQLEAQDVELLAVARRQLAARAIPRPWWSYLNGWTRSALPVGMAASVVLAVTLYAFDPTREALLDAPSLEPVSEAEDLVAAADLEDPAAALLTAETRADFLAAVLEYGPADPE